MNLISSGALRIEIVNNRQLRDEVFRLRYRAYSHEAEIPPNRSRIFTDAYDDAPNQVIWALSLEGRIVGTLRSMFYHRNMPSMLPEHNVFGDLIPTALPANARIVSGNRFAIEPELQGLGKQLTFVLLKHHMTVALVKGDWALAAVKRCHMSFMKKSCNWKPSPSRVTTTK